MSHTALIIDDDHRLFELLFEYLGGNEIVCRHAPNGAVGLELLQTDYFDVVILDVMMPDMSGLLVLKRLREFSSLPVLMLTARGDETDRVVGLELGADDYLAKPFSPRELLARIRAVVRRSSQFAIQTKENAAAYQSGALEVNPASRETRMNGTLVELTSIEFDFLVAMIRRPGRIATRSLLLQESGRSGIVIGDRAVDVHISHLRKKLADHSDGKKWIRTIRGAGYVLAPSTEESP